MILIKLLLLLLFALTIFVYINSMGIPRPKKIMKTQIKTKQPSVLTSTSKTEDHMNLIRNRLNDNSKILIKNFKDNDFAYIDNFLGIETCNEMRKEAEMFYNNNHYTISQSTKYDIETDQVISYNKHNVYSMQLDGGELYYKGPRLHEYVVSMVKHVTTILNENFKSLSLSSSSAANKLAVCTGDGSYYDKHFDNMGNNDLRKITLIYYMNMNYRTELGGAFRIFKIKDDDNIETTQDIEPLGDRLLIFEADKLVHSVLPSFANDDSEYRYALTIW